MENDCSPNVLVAIFIDINLHTVTTSFIIFLLLLEFYNSKYKVFKAYKIIFLINIETLYLGSPNVNVSVKC